MCTVSSRVAPAISRVRSKNSASGFSTPMSPDTASASKHSRNSRWSSRSSSQGSQFDAATSFNPAARIRIRASRAPSMASYDSTVVNSSNSRWASTAGSLTPRRRPMATYMPCQNALDRTASALLPRATGSLMARSYSSSAMRRTSLNATRAPSRSASADMVAEKLRL